MKKVFVGLFDWMGHWYSAALLVGSCLLLWCVLAATSQAASNPPECSGKWLAPGQWCTTFTWGAYGVHAADVNNPDRYEPWFCVGETPYGTNNPYFLRSCSTRGLAAAGWYPHKIAGWPYVQNGSDHWIQVALVVED